MGDAESDNKQRTWKREKEGECEVGGSSVLGGVGVSNGDGCTTWRETTTPTRYRDTADSAGWTNPDWIECRDNKHRPIEPGLEPLVNGAPARVVRLRGYGNAIVPQVAAAFINETFEVLHDHTHTR